MELERPQFLTQQQAEKRSNQLKHGSISYKLHLRYHKGENYEGYVEILFDLTEQFTQSDSLLLDYSGKTEGIQSIFINENKLENIVHDGLFIHLQASDLKLQAQNRIFVYFKNQYAHDGNGLHSFVDSDQKQYLYSQCEAYFCNKIFPVFDQPDLKTTMSLDVDAPSDWLVLYNTNEETGVQQQDNLVSFELYQKDIETYKAETPKEYIHHSFPATLPLPTYLFGFVAGPFNKIENPNKGFKVPMNLYCRDSLYQHLLKLSEFIFEVTEKCMDVYESFFGYEFAFPKYDQVFCPEFNCGAMENAGLVTFNDLYVFKEEVEATRLTSFSNTITHELAHHWFGNLVTMKWWNDLWLNESFADFISHFALSKMNIVSKKTSDIWALFNSRKGWGYRADQLVTTHPIAGPVANTEEAESIFDGITYAKGAASLRQLLSLMGEDAFSDAMKAYFHKYAFKNATLADFIESLNVQFMKQSVGFTLQDWEQSWLCTAGLNQCQPIFDPSNTDKNAQLKIVQTVALEQHATLRRHKIQVAFFKENGEIDSQNILLNPASETVITYDGSQNYQAVLLNYKDQSFIKILLDDHSIQFFKQNLHKVQDLLTRSLIWRAFYDMVRDGILNSEDYIEIFINSIPREVSDEIISDQFNFVSIALETMTPRKFQDVLAEKLFQFSLGYLNGIDLGNSNRIVAVKKKLLNFAKSDNSVKEMLKWFKGEHEILKKFEIGLEIQWGVVSKVFKSKAFSVEEKEAVFAEQAKRDQSDTLKNQRAKCDAYIATPEQREKLWALYMDKNQKEMSLRTFSYSLAGFNNSNCLDELQKYYELWYNSLERYCLDFSKDQFQQFYHNMFPINDNTQELIDKLEQKAQQTKGGDCVFLNKLVNESIDDLKRKLKTHQCFLAHAKLAQADKASL